MNAITIAADLNDDLRNAAKKGKTDVVQNLLRAGVNVKRFRFQGPNATPLGGRERSGRIAAGTVRVGSED